jgi:DNA-binding GntR family transcriptional regulator
MKLPLYKSLANDLRAEIESGRYPVGEQLPPETELCTLYSVSRHTMRDALRLLREARLLERRRGSGTTVLTRVPPPAFVQPLGGLDEILQFAHDARLAVRRIDERPLTSAERRRMGITDSNEWLIVEALRMSAGAPIALTEIYINAAFSGIRNELNGWTGAVQELIANRFGVEVDRIEQEISGETASAAVAKVLQIETGCGMLQTLRRYYDAEGGMMIASDSAHAGSRFVYSMVYRREA